MHGMMAVKYSMVDARYGGRKVQYGSLKYSMVDTRYGGRKVQYGGRKVHMADYNMVAVEYSGCEGQ